MYLWVIIRNDDDTFTVTEIENGTVVYDDDDVNLITEIKVGKWYDICLEEDEPEGAAPGTIKRHRLQNREEVEQVLSDFNMKIEDFDTVSDFAIRCGFSITQSAEDDLTLWAAGKQVWIHYYKSDFDTDD